jgi:hypothetical protein
MVTHRRIIINALTTLSRKLKTKEYKSKENAVIATPADRIWLIV